VLDTRNVGWVRYRGLTMAVAMATVLPLVAAGAAPALAAEPTSSSTFIDALAAIPAATEALATAREDLQAVEVRHAQAQSVAARSRAQFGAATDTLHELTLVRTRAEMASARAQIAVDDAARLMYSSGGTVPTLAEVMLTAGSEEELIRSLVTRRYLSSAADVQVQAGAWADEAAVLVDQARARAVETWEVAADYSKSAATDLVSAGSAVTAAKVAVDAAQKKYKKLMRITKVDRSADYGHIKKCGDGLTKLLSKTGFQGENLREAWAIVMRESGGRADAISVSNDLGLFQINTATWQDQPWFDREELLKRKFNAKVGYLLSRGGETWYSWGLDGHGRPDARAYVKAGWTQERIVAKIVEPYVLWYSLYPCRPAYEKLVWVDLPFDVSRALKPRAEDGVDEPVAAGSGQLPSQTGVGRPTPIDPVTPPPTPVSPAPTPSIVVDPPSAAANPTEPSVGQGAGDPALGSALE
jgi:hypothetical protein